MIQSRRRGPVLAVKYWPRRFFDMAKFWEVLREKYKERRLAAAEEKSSGEEKPWLIAGLGNFGPEYAESRHNCGFRALDRCADKLSGNIEEGKHRFKGIVRKADYEGHKLLLLWPQTYMNSSGESIGEAMRWYGIDEKRLIVIYDDSDIEPGKLRIRAKGSAGSHNGMKSVLQHTESDEFARIRIGIGKKPERFDMIDFVLGKFTPEERPIVEAAEEKAAEAALSIVKNGCEKTMSLFNSTKNDATAKKEGETEEPSDI